MGTVKSGWLQKLSGFFKNTWKKRYFVLYQSGDFCYYQDPHDKELDGKINMKTECRTIAVGHGVGEGVKAPKDIDALFSVISTERTFYLVADSATEAREWVTALEQARAPVSYGGNVAAGSYPQQPAAPYGQPQSGPPPAYTPNAAPGPYPMPNPGSAYPPPVQGYPAQPYPQPGPYPQQGYPPGAPGAYPQQPPPGAYPQQPPPGVYPQQPPGAYPQQQYRPPGPTAYAQGPAPQTVYVQNPNQGHQKSSSKNKMLMGAGAGALGGAALGYMLGSATGGFGGGHGYGGWDSDHSWSSGSFDCDFD